MLDYTDFLNGVDTAIRRWYDSFDPADDVVMVRDVFKALGGLFFVDAVMRDGFIAWCETQLQARIQLEDGASSQFRYVLGSEHGNVKMSSRVHEELEKWKQDRAAENLARMLGFASWEEYQAALAEGEVGVDLLTPEERTRYNEELQNMNPKDREMQLRMSNDGADMPPYVFPEKWALVCDGENAVLFLEWVKENQQSGFRYTVEELVSNRFHYPAYVYLGDLYHLTGDLKDGYEDVTFLQWKQRYLSPAKPAVSYDSGLPAPKDDSQESLREAYWLGFGIVCARKFLGK